MRRLLTCLLTCLAVTSFTSCGSSESINITTEDIVIDQYYTIKEYKDMGYEYTGSMGVDGKYTVTLKAMENLPEYLQEVAGAFEGRSVRKNTELYPDFLEEYYRLEGDVFTYVEDLELKIKFVNHDSVIEKYEAEKEKSDSHLSMNESKAILSAKVEEVTVVGVEYRGSLSDESNVIFAEDKDNIDGLEVVEIKATVPKLVQ